MRRAPFILLFAALFIQNASAQKILFKDENLKSALLNQGFDRNKDGEIEVSEIDTVTKLNVSKKNIKSLDDLKYFKNLKDINANNNQIENLDVFFDNPIIEGIYVGNNPLGKHLILKNIKNLKWFVAFRSNLESIDFSGTNAIEHLYILDNDFENMAFPNLTNLKGLVVSGNKKLKSIDISSNKKLDQLDALDTSISKLNVVNNPLLSLLYVEKRVQLIKGKNQSNIKPAPIIKVDL